MEALLKGYGKESLLLLTGLVWKSPCSFSDSVFLFPLSAPEVPEQGDEVENWGNKRAVKQKLKWHSEECDTSWKTWSGYAAPIRNSWAPPSSAKNNRMGKSQRRSNQKHSFLLSPQSASEMWKAGSVFKNLRWLIQRRDLHTTLKRPGLQT